MGDRQTLPSLNLFEHMSHLFAVLFSFWCCDGVWFLSFVVCVHSTSTMAIIPPVSLEPKAEGHWDNLKARALWRLALQATRRSHSHRFLDSNRINNNHPRATSVPPVLKRFWFWNLGGPPGDCQPGGWQPGDDGPCFKGAAPDAVLLRIFGFLEPADLVVVTETCRRWAVIGNQPEVSWISSIAG